MLVDRRASSDRGAAFCCAAELGGPGFENLLVISPTEVNFFGRGSLVGRLGEEFPGGWSGGALPERGFWGHGDVDGEKVVEALAREIEG